MYSTQLLEQQLIQEVGMHIIDPHTHYTMTANRRRYIFEMLLNRYCIVADDNLIDVFIENEDRGWWEDIGKEMAEELNCSRSMWNSGDQSPQERANDFADEAEDYCSDHALLFGRHSYFETI